MKPQDKQEVIESIKKSFEEAKKIMMPFVNNELSGKKYYTVLATIALLEDFINKLKQDFKPEGKETYELYRALIKEITEPVLITELVKKQQRSKDET